MKINCILCGHNFDLNDTYDDYEEMLSAGSVAASWILSYRKAN